MERVNKFNTIYAQCNQDDPVAKLESLKDFPTYMDIELTNHCNYHCLMCPTGTGAVKRPRGYMSEEIFDQILEEIKDKKTPLRFIRWGEPSLHKDFFKFIKKAKDLDIMCHINTNGTLLDEEGFKRLIDMKLDSIKFSFQGIDAKSYREMRSEDYFEQLLEKIELLYKMRGDRELPYIHIATTVTYESPEAVAAFVERAEKIADKVSVGRTKLDHIDIEKVRLTPEDKARMEELREKESLVKVRFKSCPEVFDKLSVDWDGKVTACCTDYDNKMVVGNLADKSLQEIWQGPKMRAYQEGLARREYDKYNLCKDCYDYMSLQGDNLQKL